MSAAGSAPGTRTRWWLAAAALAGLLAVAGIASPKHAVTAITLGGVGLAAVAAAYALAELLSRVRAAQRSDFAPTDVERPPQVLPHHIARIAPTPTERKPVLSPGARAGLATVVTERLWANHGLNLHDPAHLDRIRDRLSPALWDCVRPERVDGRGLPVARPPFLHADLARLLDDAESI